MSDMSVEQTKKLSEIAQKMGCTIEALLQTGKSPSELIESYERGELTMLNEG